MAGLFLDSDRPIDSPDQDLLERAPLVRQLVSHVVASPTDAGFVIGLSGPWGSGKSSVLRLVERELEAEGVCVLRFDPWLFSGVEALLPRFFTELSGQLMESPGDRLTAVGSALLRYGVALAPIVSLVVPPVGQVAQAAAPALDDRSSVHSQRRVLREMLQKRPQRIVVIIDDIDRLLPFEIAELMSLVKMVGDLPGVTYLLGYERQKVQSALDEAGASGGYGYLEKIVQLPFTLPPIPAPRLHGIAMRWIWNAIGDREVVAWQPKVWEDIYGSGVAPYLATLRDARRLANVAPSALDLVGDEVATTDVLALEVLRMFDPAVHDALSDLEDVLVGRGALSWNPKGKKGRRQRERLECVLDQSVNRRAARHLLLRLFPIVGLLWGDRRMYDSLPNAELGDRRMHQLPIFARYIHAVVGSTEVPRADVETALSLLDRPEAFVRYLAETDDARLFDLITRLRGRLDEAPPFEPVDLTRALIDSLDRILPRGGDFELPAILHVLWATESAVLTLPVGQRRNAVLRLLGDARSLSERLWFVARFSAVAERPDLRILSESETGRELDRITQLALNADPSLLEQEPELMQVLATIRTRDREALASIMGVDLVVAAFLKQYGTHDGPLELFPTHAASCSLDEWLTEEAFQRRLIRFVREADPKLKDDAVLGAIDAVLSRKRPD